jgi:hypothetical protein
MKIKIPGDKAIAVYPSGGRSVYIPGGSDAIEVFKAGGIKYILRDEFLTADPSPIITPRTAEPGPGTGVFTDTGNLFSISGEALRVVGNAGWGNTCLAYDAVTRAAGIVLATSFYASGATGYVNCILGFFNAQTSFFFAHAKSGLAIKNDRKFYFSPGDVDTTYTWEDNTRYDIQIELKATGCKIFVKGGTYTDWTLISNQGTDATATLYPGFTSEANDFTIIIDYFRIPEGLYVS